MVVAGTMSLTRASVNSRFAPWTATTPETIPHGSGPLTVNPDIRTWALCATRTIEEIGMPLRVTAYGVSAAGDLMSVAPAPAPLNVEVLAYHDFFRVRPASDVDRVARRRGVDRRLNRR